MNFNFFYKKPLVIELSVESCAFIGELGYLTEENRETFGDIDT